MMLQQKPKFRSTSLQTMKLKTSLPSLKYKQQNTKLSFGLTKIQMNSNLPITNKNFKRQVKTQVKQLGNQLKYKRSFTGLKNPKKAMNNYFKTTKAFNIQKMIQKEVKMLQQANKTNYKPQKQHKNIQNPSQQSSLPRTTKIQNKTAGIIKSYSVDSHCGPLNSINQDRISIMTNVHRFMKKTQQISFFGIYSGKNGIARAQYMRDYFHPILFNDEYFEQNFEYAVKRSFDIIEKNLIYDQTFKNDTSFVSFILCVFIDETAYFIKSGELKGLISLNLGSQIISSQTKKIQRKDLKSLKRFQNKQKQRTVFQNIDVRKFQLDKNYDFLLLGNEGLFQHLKIRQIGQIIWQVALRQQNFDFNSILNQCCHELFNKAYQRMGTKSISLIVIGLPQMQKCLDNSSDQIQLPFVDKK